MYVFFYVDMSYIALWGLFWDAIDTLQLKLWT